MPNAKDLKTGDAPKRFLMVGKFGSGKTAQFLTLPGKKFLYVFDANSLPTIEGYDVDYECFFPEQLVMRPQSLKKENRVSMKKPPKAMAYLNWEAHFEEGLASGFFDQYDIIGWDSWTTFSDLMMDHILDLNGRAGQFPQQDDWGPQIVAMSNVFRTASGMGKVIFCTAHEELVKDEISGKVQNQILVTGKLKIRLPILFSEIYHCTVEVNRTDGKARYMIQTKPDRENPFCRTSIKGISTYEDVTIEDWSRPEQYGLGALLRRAKEAQGGGNVTAVAGKR